MLRVVSYAQTIGVISRSGEAAADLDSFASAVDALGRLGVARHLRSLPTGTAPQMSRLAAAVLAAIDDSPIPSAEWEPLFEILGDLMPSLLAISPSSVARYRSGGRATPDDVAGRLHVIAQIVADLAGSYNDFGIRRWFGRPRQALDGRAPNQILHGSWSPDDPDVRKVRDLAQALLGAAIG